MEIDTAYHQARSYNIATPIFEGPLDLLLHLIERAELDITKLALAQVTDQYLEHIRGMNELAAEEVSAFLVIAARLLQIKSEILLPRAPQREDGEEDPGEALARQLLIYVKFKRSADWLAARDASGLRSYVRLAPPVHVEAALDLSGLTLDDLVEAASHVLFLNDLRPELRTVVTPSPVTIRQKISLIFRTMREKGRATFLNLLSGSRSRLEVVVTFLAMLELIKRHRIQAHQTVLFGEIELESAPNMVEEEEFELEFGE